MGPRCWARSVSVEIAGGGRRGRGEKTQAAQQETVDAVQDQADRDADGNRNGPLRQHIAE